MCLVVIKFQGRVALALCKLTCLSSIKLILLQQLELTWKLRGGMQLGCETEGLLFLLRSNIELVWEKLWINSGKLLLGTIQVPPSINSMQVGRRICIYDHSFLC